MRRKKPYPSGDLDESGRASATKEGYGNGEGWQEAGAESETDRTDGSHAGARLELFGPDPLA
jgi:hypothetical protein